MGGQITLERTGPVATLRIDNPEQRNALTPRMLDELVEHFTALESDHDVRCVVLRGAGEVFSSGYALNHIGGGDELPYPDEISSTCEAIERSRLVTVAVLEGFAVGGSLELICACDFRFARAGTRLGITPARFSLVYSVTGMARIMRVVGEPNTRELFLTGRLVDAQRAHEMGLVNEVHPDAETLEAATAAFTEEIASVAPLSLAGSKRVLYELAQANPLPHDLAIELHKLRAEAMDSQDAAEAREAFAEKRPARFQGR